MAKVRVHHLAHELNMKSKEFIQRAQELGYDHIKSHANTLEASEAAELKAKIEQGQGSAKPKRKQTVLRRRTQRNSNDGGYQVTITRLSAESEQVIESKRIETPVIPEIVLPTPIASPAPDEQTTAVEEPASTQTTEVPQETLTPAPEASVSTPPVSVEVTQPVSQPTQEVQKTVVETPQEETHTTTPPTPQQEATPVAAKTKVKEPVATPQVETAVVTETPAQPVENKNTETKTETKEEPVVAAPKAPTKETPVETPTQPTSPAPTSPTAQAQPVSQPEPSMQQETTATPAAKPTKQEKKQEKKTPAKEANPALNQLLNTGLSQDVTKKKPKQPSRKFKEHPADRNTGSDIKRMEAAEKYSEKAHKVNKKNKPSKTTTTETFNNRKPNYQKKNNRKQTTFDRRRNRRNRRRDSSSQPTQSTAPMKAEKKVIKVDEAISVADLAHKMGIKATDIIRKLLSQGVMATINQALTVETATDLAKSYGYEIQDVSFDEEEILEETAEVEDDAELKPRSPVIAVMGHVDHGKPSLLDAIRETNVAAREAGGITQHIGASVVKTSNGNLVFLDTPGHEAFTAMRARGAQSTDIVILVVAADDGIMPQTQEAISHAQAAGVPIVVAINKIDKLGADPANVRNELTRFNLIPEEWGGETLMCNVSAHTKEGIPELLEQVALQAELLELKANPNKRARGTVIEARIEKGRGPVATLLVQEGTLSNGDAVVAGTFFGKVRAMFSDAGKKLKKVGPSTPVRILGLNGLPTPGEQFDNVKDTKDAERIAQHRLDKEKTTTTSTGSMMTFEDFFSQGKKELNIILKADVQGTLEAIKDSLSKLTFDEIEVKVLHAGVGGITESDINLASTTEHALIVGFHVRADNKAQRMAEAAGIEVRIYRVIYDLINEVKAFLQQQLAPTVQEKPIGQAEIRQIFSIPKVGKIAGCYVTDGKITRNALMRLFREDIQIYEGKVSSLRRFKNDAKEVGTGYECGIQIEGYQDIREGDVIEAYELEEVETKLES